MSRDLSRHVGPADRPFDRPDARAPEEAGAPFRLGMPHLDGDGVSLVWLLKDCAHRHWWSIADWTGLRPSLLRDRTGARAMASVVVAAVRGAPERFREDDLVVLDLAVAPRPETGWRSCCRLVSTSGAAVTVELVTVFAKRGGRSNAALAPADMPSRFRAERGGEGARRAAVLRARGRAARAASPRAPAGQARLEVFGPKHFNGMGLMYFANFVEAIERAERAALPPPRPMIGLSAREIHYFGNIDEGDTLEMGCAVAAAGIGPAASVELTSIARRRSDDAVIAICLSGRYAA